MGNQVNLFACGLFTTFRVSHNQLVCQTAKARLCARLTLALASAKLRLTLCARGREEEPRAQSQAGETWLNFRCGTHSLGARLCLPPADARPSGRCARGAAARAAAPGNTQRGAPSPANCSGSGSGGRAVRGVQVGCSRGPHSSRCTCSATPAALLRSATQEMIRCCCCF